MRTHGDRSIPVAGAGLVLLAAAGSISAQVHVHEDGSTHSHGLHFSHPMITESVSPDTKLRLDFEVLKLDTDAEELRDEWTSLLALEGEYAFHRSFSIEAQLPYGLEDGEVGELHVGFKFANYAFEESGLLLGYGLDFGFPTGDHVPTLHGSEEEGEGAAHTGGGSVSASSSSSGGGTGEDIYEIEPFLNVGLMRGPWELVAFNVFGIPTNQGEQSEVGTEWLYNLSALFHATNDVQLLLEYAGETGMSGPEAGETTGTLSPGLKVRPIADRSLFIGAAASFPVAGETGFDPRLRVSAFWHF